MDRVRRELVKVLREARSLLARPNNDFYWSSWENAAAALDEVDGLIAVIESGRLPGRLAMPAVVVRGDLARELKGVVLTF